MRRLTMTRRLAAAAFGLASLTMAAIAVPQTQTSAPAWLTQIKTYDRAAWSRTVTPCDRLAAHPDDPEKVSDGVAQSAMDIPAAIAACTAAVSADPDNPRLNYQLARAFGYAGRHQDGAAYRQKALMSGYPQSLFVVGFIMITGWGGAAAEPCTGGALVRLSGLAGRKAGLIGYPHYVVNGTLASCDAAVDKAELIGFLDRARPLLTGYYEQLLVENLRARISALP